MNDDKIINGAVGEKEFQQVILRIDDQLKAIKDAMTPIAEFLAERPCNVHELEIKQNKEMRKIIETKVPEIDLNTRFRLNFSVTKVGALIIAVMGIAKGFEYLIKFIMKG